MAQGANADSSPGKVRRRGLGGFVVAPCARPAGAASLLVLPLAGPPMRPPYLPETRAASVRRTGSSVWRKRRRRRAATDAVYHEIKPDLPRPHKGAHSPLHHPVRGFRSYVRIWDEPKASV